MKKLIVGCPIKNDLESFKAMYESLINSVDLPFELIIIVGGGTDNETLNYLYLIENEGRVRIVNEQTKTPLEAYNKLFNLAKLEQSDLLLTQTDVLFPRLYKRDWLQIMKNVAQEETVGAVTCIGGTGISGPDYINGLEWLGGHCTYIPFRTIEKLGGYDEGFPNGFGVDIDYTYRIHLSELKIVKINYWCDHHMMNERLHDNDEKAEEMKQESSKYFKKKWNLN